MPNLLIKNRTKIKVSSKLFLDLIKTGQKVLKKEIREIHLNLTGLKLIRRINKIYRQKDRATDTISFAFGETEKFPKEVLGEIFISLPQIKINAKKYKKTFKKELGAVFVHSLLHLLGYTHKTDSEAKRMERKGEEILRLQDYKSRDHSIYTAPL